MNGKAVFTGGHVVTLDEPALYRESAHRASRIIKDAGLELDGGPRTTNLYD